MKSEIRRKTKTGVVLTDAMDKSVLVSVARTVLDPTYKKYIRRKSKFMAHDEANACKVGDKVRIRECRPLSKRKRWRVEEVLVKSTGVE
ncbi:MAG TPA: 30S ribosomal protein S17 [bacterium]|nr:30S ribosomal protein S17 [bacterium]